MKEDKSIGEKLLEVIFLSLMGAAMFVSQVIMASLPNIEIVSLLIILTTLEFGYKALASVYVFVFCEIFTYGLGIWSANYLYVWAILCLAVLPLRKIDNTFVFAFVAAIFGLLFGSLCSIPYFFAGGFAGGIGYITAGLTFDLLHCGGNFITTIVLYKPLRILFKKLFKLHK